MGVKPVGSFTNGSGGGDAATFQYERSDANDSGGANPSLRPNRSRIIYAWNLAAFASDVVPARPAWHALFHLNAFFWRFDIPIDWGERGSDRETSQGSDDVKLNYKLRACRLACQTSVGPFWASLTSHLLLPRMGSGPNVFLLDQIGFSRV